MTAPVHAHAHADAHAGAHAHADGAAHAGAGEPLHGPSGPASVVIDIGGEIGAAVVLTPAQLAGREIEIRPRDGEWDGTHTAVRERHVSTATVYAAVFGSLREGSYDLRIRGGAREEPQLVLHVHGGSVANALWPEP
jgi:hypothetical protein